MTAVVACVGPHGKTVFGADSLSTIDDGNVRVMAETKIWRSGPYLFGGAGAGRGIQVARYTFKPPQPKGRDLDHFIGTAFVNALRDAMRESGHMEKKDNAEKIGSDLLVGVRGSLYLIYEEFDFDRLVEDYAAIGTGALPALGSLYSTKKMGATKQRLTLALSAAEMYDNSVRRPFRFLDSEE